MGDSQEQSDDPAGRFRDGDPHAFEDLYSQHSPAILAYLAGKTRCLADAEDLAHAVWTKAWEKREQFSEGHFRGWVFRIARTTLIDHQRSAKRRKISELQDNDVATNSEPSSEEDRADQLRSMRDCMDSLSHRLFTVIKRVKIENAAPVDVAAEIGTSRGQIDKDVHRAKKQLRDCMELKLK